MTKKELIRKLYKAQSDDDREGAHYEMDALLLEFINDEDVKKAYHFREVWYA